MKSAQLKMEIGWSHCAILWREQKIIFSKSKCQFEMDALEMRLDYYVGLGLR